MSSSKLSISSIESHEIPRLSAQICISTFEILFTVFSGLFHVTTLWPLLVPSLDFGNPAFLKRDRRGALEASVLCSLVETMEFPGRVPIFEMYVLATNRWALRLLVRLVLILRDS